MPSLDPEYSKKHYSANKKKYAERLCQRRRQIKDWFDDYKSKLKCNRCNESHPACIQFHHTNPNEKEIEIAYAVGQGWSTTRILEEINKCEILCANCHSKHHWHEKRNEQHFPLYMAAEFPSDDRYQADLGVCTTNIYGDV